MRPDQLGEFSIAADPRLHPDGARVAFVVTRMDLEADRYVKRIWMWDGDQARPLTAGPSDTSPRWSPDGSKLAFLRKGTAEGAKSQVAVLDLSGGEAETITDFPLGVTELHWSPDGARLAVAALEWIPELADVDDDERKRRPRRVTGFPYRFDNLGWVGDMRSHLHLVEIASGTTTQLTSGDFDESDIAWHPDGETIAFLSARHHELYQEPGSRAWVVPATGGELRPVTDIGLWNHISYDRVGRLHVVGIRDPWGHPDVAPLWRIEGDGSLTDLTGPLDRNIVIGAPAVSPAGPQWLEDGGAIITIEDRGSVRLARMDADGKVTDLVEGPRAVTGASPNVDGSVVAFTATSPTQPAELFLLSDGEERRVTDLNDGFLSTAGLVSPERFVLEHDGFEIEGWVFLPPGEEQVPILFNIHGGPASAYGNWFFDEFQVYAGAGYGVVAINPRGSSGYGSKHVRSIIGTWHRGDSPDMVDLLAAVDAAAARFPRLDSDRMGVMGGSYGGYATARVIARDHRFRSAVAERGLYSYASFRGTSDIGPWFTRMYLGADGVADYGTVWESGPLAEVDAITTPTLVVHSEGDFRTPIEQGSQLFVRLLANGVPTEMLRFPAPEGHELSRSGKPKHRVERFEAILEWHARHLS